MSEAGETNVICLFPENKITLNKIILTFFSIDKAENITRLFFITEEV